MITTSTAPIKTWHITQWLHSAKDSSVSICGGAMMSYRKWRDWKWPNFFFSYSQSQAWINAEWPSIGWSNVLLEIPHSENGEYYTTYPKTIIEAILYCYSNMGRDYIHELYLTPSDSEGLNLMNIMLVVYGYSRICGGSRGSDHCACLTRSDVTGNHVTFPPYFTTEWR
jgi:hypothetical protein